MIFVAKRAKKISKGGKYWKGMKMKKMNVQYVLVALSLMAFAFTTNTWAEDVSATAKFMEQCTESSNFVTYEPACCELMLKTFSDGHREGAKRQLSFIEGMVKKNLKPTLTTPGMTKEKIDAVCSLYDSGKEQSWLAERDRAAGDKDGYHSHSSQAKQLMEQSRKLFESYVSDDNGSSGKYDAAFQYCNSRNQLNQMKKDLREDDGKLFPSAKRRLELNALRAYQEVSRATRHVKCRKKPIRRIKEPVKTTADAVQAKSQSGKDSPAQAMANSGAANTASGDQKGKKAKPLANPKEGESVYEKCVSNRQWSTEFDCRCLAQKVVELRAKRGPEPLTELLAAEIQRNGSCRNIPETTRREYATCMRGSGFDYRGIPQEDYCECYAQTWGKLYGEYEGKIDEHRKSNIRLKARVYCYKPGAYKGK
jgi:hypothetical protein